MSGEPWFGWLGLALSQLLLVPSCGRWRIRRLFDGLGLVGLSMMLLSLTGCTPREAPSTPRPASVSPGQPVVATCSGTPCWCAEPATAYERCASSVSNFPAGYAGSGSRTVTVLTDSPGMVHCWPATACGDLMAANSECPCTEGRYAEVEMLARELTRWGAGPMALRPGLDYWVRQGAATVYVSATMDSVEVK